MSCKQYIFERFRENKKLEKGIFSVLNKAS
jgi:hypothetical protein